MKKCIFFLSILGLMVACASDTKPKDEISEDLIKQIEVIEETTQDADALIKESETEFETTQNEIDSLLNNI